MTSALFSRWNVLSLVVGTLALAGVLVAIVMGLWSKPSWSVVVFLAVLIVASVGSLAVERAMPRLAARLRDAPVPAGLRLRAPVWIRFLSEGFGIVAVGAVPAVGTAVLGFPGVGWGIQLAACGVAIFTAVIHSDVAPALTFEERGLRVHTRGIHFLIPWESISHVELDDDDAAWTYVDIEDPGVVLESAAPTGPGSRMAAWAFLDVGRRPGSSVKFIEWSGGLDAPTLTRAIGERVASRRDRDDERHELRHSSSDVLSDGDLAVTRASSESLEIEIHEKDEPRLRGDLLLAISGAVALAVVGAAIGAGLRQARLYPVAAFLVVTVVSASYLVVTEHVIRRRASRLAVLPVSGGARLRKPRWLISSLLLMPVALVASGAAVVAGVGFPAVGLGLLLSIGGFGGLFNYAVMDKTLDITFESAGLRIHRARLSCVLPWTSILELDVWGPASRRRLFVTVADPEAIIASAVPDHPAVRIELKRFIFWRPHYAGRILLPPWTGGLDALSLARAVQRATEGTEVAAN
jgi:hypothetical protein